MSNDMPRGFTFIYGINLLILSNNNIYQKLFKNQTLTALITAILTTGQGLVDV